MKLNPSVAPQDAPRLAGQCLLILQRLLRGPATNVEFSALSLKYTSRLSEIKQAGHNIVATRGKGGIWTYTLAKPVARGQLKLI